MSSFKVLKDIIFWASTLPAYIVILYGFVCLFFICVRPQVADLDALCTALSTVVFFSRLDEPTVQSLAKCVQYERFKPRQTVFSYGDYGDKYYLLLTGRVGVEVPVPQPNGAMHNLQVAILEAGAGFGEMALLEDMPRSATIQALEPTETLCKTLTDPMLDKDSAQLITLYIAACGIIKALDREHYQALAMEKHREVFHRNVSFLQCLPFLVGCPTGDIKALAEQLVEKTYSGPEVIVRQGQEATQVVLVKRGSVLVLRTVNTGAKGKFFDLRKPAGGSPSSINDLGSMKPPLSLCLVLQILEGEKATAVQQRGSTYSATLVAFPAAQIFVIEKRLFLKTLTEPLRLCFGLASSPLPSDVTLLRHYFQSVRWERYKSALVDELPKVYKFERDRTCRTIRQWELPPKVPYTLADTLNTYLPTVDAIILGILPSYDTSCSSLLEVGSGLCRYPRVSAAVTLMGRLS
ncbi:cyclic nucleotide-binding domain-containing protein [Cyclospora cayetanensis]|uniref:Cyclic nucleotide-binding domain-containing protein n=1 Tax=Cyclospora cayetanensis TaxID=88456 RepID=A0A1D3CTK0_9EIME|nr:cyclic nucleotide-binding domain-containing protein [Cyclospora cayetanensis]